MSKFETRQNKDGNIEIILSGEHNDIFVITEDEFEEIVKFMMTSTSDGNRSIIFVDTLCTNWCVCDKYDRVTKFSEVKFEENHIIITQLSVSKEFSVEIFIPSWIV